MPLKFDAKFKGKLTLGSKNELRNLVYFNASNDISGNLHFDVILLSKAYKVLGKYRRVISLYTEEWSKLWKKKLTFCLKNGMGNLVNYNASSGNSKTLHFDRLFLSKVCNVLAKKIKTSCAVKNFWHKFCTIL